MSHDVKVLQKSIARAVANRDVSVEALQVVAKQFAKLDYPIRRIDTCPYGIWVDYFINDNWYEALPKLIDFNNGVVRKIEVFPYGIWGPDFFHVRVQHDFDEIPALKQF